MIVINAAAVPVTLNYCRVRVESRSRVPRGPHVVRASKNGASSLRLCNDWQRHRNSRL